jgi:ABC-2 type transport system permease protein
MTFLQQTLGRNYKWWYVYKFGINASTAYRWSNLFWLFSKFIILSFTILLWKINIDGGSGIFNFEHIFTYYIIGLIFLPDNGVHYGLSHSITDGKINNRLLYPVKTTTLFFVENMGWKYFTSVIEVLVVIILALIQYQSLILVQAVDILPFLLLCFLAFVIKVYYNFIIGSLTFFFIDISGVIDSQTEIIGFLSGKILPLDAATFLLPLSYLPFAYMYYYPMQVWFGEIKGWNLVQTIGIGLFWVLILHTMLTFVYKKGLKRYEAIGL